MKFHTTPKVKAVDGKVINLWFQQLMPKMTLICATSIVCPRLWHVKMCAMSGWLLKRALVIYILGSRLHFERRRRGMSGACLISSETAQKCCVHTQVHLMPQIFFFFLLSNSDVNFWKWADEINQSINRGGSEITVKHGRWGGAITSELSHNGR